jgi:hypothetical protein
MVNRKTSGFILLFFMFISVLAVKTLYSSSQETSLWGNITFTTYRYAFKFFDHNTGKIYVYAQDDGRLEQVWLLEELGKDLKKLR